MPHITGHIARSSCITKKKIDPADRFEPDRRDRLSAPSPVLGSIDVRADVTSDAQPCGRPWLTFGAPVPIAHDR